MMKKYRGTLIVTTLVMLLPMLAGLILWDKLPEQVPIHFNSSGEVDGWSGRAMAVFGLPAILIALHWVCAAASLLTDPKAENLEGKMLGIVFWVFPVLSLLCTGLVYATAMGGDVPVQIIITLFLGLMAVVVGNWLPKCKQTYTLGIRTPWTLADEDNWNRTHRLAGPVWVVGGLLMMLISMLESKQVAVVGILLAMAAIPMVYSYLLFRKSKRQ